MSDPKFTAGPWDIAAWNDDSEHQGQVSAVTQSDEERVICEFLKSESGESQTANAHLIAAAPEMYAALEELLAWQNGPPLPTWEEKHNAAVSQAYAALAKARGE